MPNTAEIAINVIGEAFFFISVFESNRMIARNTVRMKALASKIVLLERSNTLFRIMYEPVASTIPITQG